MTDRDELVTRLGEAMDNGEFEMFFQPEFDAQGKPVAVESLIRWRHPERGLIPPVVFLAICEDSGLILPLGRWVLGEACAYHFRLVEAGWPGVTVSVNMSTAQFEDTGMVDYLRKLVTEFNIPAGAIELELSEGTVMHNPNRSVEILTAVRGLGVGIAIGEFGTGYSSMSTLHRVPADKIKIDRSVVRGVHEDGNNAAICRSIISLAHGKDLVVIAEGVELSEEHTWLRANGCDGVQGYLFARPAPFEDMLRALGSLPA
ncbi:MAG: EAL domain-containing protein [Gammaproteobacteria bacterium]|nr:EAL domain-containing protein [Gammaproteobacteria bacterium]